MHISIVSPVYGCGACIRELVDRCISALQSITKDYEIILVNDCGPDNAWDEIQKLCKENSRIIGIQLSRNFGQHYAISAGLTHVRGEWVVVLDCDLQDQPEEIPRLYAKAMEGFQLVLAQRAERQDSYFKKLGSRIYYSTFSFLTGSPQDASVANFGIYHKKVIDAVLSMGDAIRYFPTMVQWVGFKKYWLPVKHSTRQEGKSSYNLKKLLKLAFNNIIAFSDKPLRITIQFGLFISLISFIIGVVIITKYLLGDITVLGYASLILSIWFLSGILMAVLGVVGIYVGKTFEKVKDRPLYIIDEIINYSPEKE